MITNLEYGKVYRIGDIDPYILMFIIPLIIVGTIIGVIRSYIER